MPLFGRSCRNQEQPQINANINQSVYADTVIKFLPVSSLIVGD